MKKVKRFLSLLLLSVFFISSCSKDDDSTTYIPTSIVQFVNAYSYSNAVLITDAYGNIVTPGFYPLSFRDYTSPAPFFAGNRIINVVGPANKIVSQSKIELRDSAYYTSFIYGNTDEAKNLFAVNKSIKDFDKTKSAVRFLHLASNIGPVNVYMNNMETPLFLNRAVETSVGISEEPNTNYTSQNAGKTKIIVTDMNNDLVMEREFDFKASDYYTIVLVGDKNSDVNGLYIGVTRQ